MSDAWHVTTAVLFASGVVTAFVAYIASIGCAAALFDGDSDKPRALLIAGAFYAASPILFCLFMVGWTATG